MNIKKIIDKSWYEAFNEKELRILEDNYNAIEQNRLKYEILPYEDVDSGIYYALRVTQFDNVKVLIMGQDPYPNKEDAHGLAFSKKSGKIPASLKNIFFKIKEDVCVENTSGNLTHWAEQGVLLLNRALTYSKEETLAKRNKFWLSTIDIIINKLLERNKPLVVFLWGNPANDIEQFSFENENYLKNHNIYILRSSHPSNMGNAKNSELKYGKIKAFTKVPNFKICNDILKANGEKEIDWTT